MRCPKYLCDCSNKQWYHSDCLPLRFYSFLPSTMVSMYLQTTASPEEELLQVHVRARATTCPILQCFVCLCGIRSTNCQSSCISKHSYMHNHAFYMFMHLIKLSCYSHTFALSIPMLISIKINHVNSKFITVMSISKFNSLVLTFLSNSSSCRHVRSISICFYNTICFC